jgi:hypothetical protein
MLITFIFKKLFKFELFKKDSFQFFAIDICTHIYTYIYLNLLLMSILKEFVVGDKVCGRSTANNNSNFNDIGIIKDILKTTSNRIKYFVVKWADGSQSESTAKEIWHTLFVTLLGSNICWL